MEVENQINDTTPVPFTELTFNERNWSVGSGMALAVENQINDTTPVPITEVPLNGKSTPPRRLHPDLIVRPSATSPTDSTKYHGSRASPRSYHVVGKTPWTGLQVKASLTGSGPSHEERSSGTTQSPDIDKIKMSAPTSPSPECATTLPMRTWVSNRPSSGVHGSHPRRSACQCHAGMSFKSTEPQN